MPCFDHLRPEDVRLGTTIELVDGRRFIYEPWGFMHVNTGRNLTVEMAITLVNDADATVVRW